MVNNIRLIVLTLIILSCEKSNDNDNPFIPDVRFEKIININLPTYNDLKYNGGSYYINGLGVKGVILLILMIILLLGKPVVLMKNPQIVVQWRLKGFKQNVNATLIFTA